MTRSKLLAAGLASLMIAGGVAAAVAPPASAASGPVFGVMNTSESPPDGVYFRNSPNWSDTSRTYGLGVFMGEQVQLECYAFGQAIGQYNDSLWYYALNVSRPLNYDGQANQGMLNAHYINDGQAANVVDAGVPPCVNNRPPAATPTVTLGQGPAAPAGYRYAVTLSGFAANSGVSVTCYDSVSSKGFYTFTLTTDGSGATSTANYCYSGDGPDHWVLANGVQSNHVTWGGSSGGGGDNGHTIINGVDVGIAQNDPHTWGGCYVQDFNQGPYGWVIVSYTNGTHVVRNGVLWGWFDNGGAPGFGCPQSDEHAYSDGVRQDFTNGSLYWVGGMDHAKRVTWTDLSNIHWAGYIAGGSLVSSVRGEWHQPTIDCSRVNGSSEAMFWVGIDGVSGGRLIQAGSGGLCNNRTSRPDYFVWTETDPSHSAIRVDKLSPGDDVKVVVSFRRGDSTYTMSIIVNGRSVANVSGLSRSTIANSGECVAEAPVGTSGLLPLAKFSFVRFSSCMVTTALHSTAVSIASGALPPELTARRVSMSGPRGAKAVTGLPHSDGPWNVTWTAP